MLAASRLRRRGSSADYWPGFVDLMSTLLLVMIFLLVVYMLAQYFLQRTLSGQEDQLSDISAELNNSKKELAVEQQANAELRINIAQIAAQLQSSLSVRDQLIAELSMVTGERDTLQLRLREMTGAGQTAMAEAAEASIRADAGEDKIKVMLADIERLRRDIDALNAVRRDLESKVGVMAAALIESRGELGESEEETASVRADLSALRDTTTELEARLSDERERTVLAQRTLEEREIRLAEVQALHLAAQSSYDSSQAALAENQALSARQRDQIAVLNQQIDALRSQLGRVERALQISEQKTEEQEVTIANLGQRLNMALAAKVEELAAYRSEFFGRLREVLSERRDFNIIGDRFVFQSEVLFASASHQLEAEGHERLAQFAQVLREVMVQIPSELPWILQVDGHTDSRPIQTARFPSNWELSAARAISVVNFLIALGIPPDRLSATGYGEFQPLDDRDDEIAHRRNRRIELKLTQR
ncbi:MAG: peptidoglycan -binding protein [Rhodospirillaceae bacterium]|nr:peptidoglycan -binding protein [Rhodospirillaceae bacterium]